MLRGAEKETLEGLSDCDGGSSHFAGANCAFYGAGARGVLISQKQGAIISRSHCDRQTDILHVKYRPTSVSLSVIVVLGVRHPQVEGLLATLLSRPRPSPL